MAYDKKTPIITQLDSVEIETKNGYLDISEKDELATLTVFERHGKNGNKENLYRKEFGTKKGCNCINCISRLS